MKKFLSLSLALVMILSLAACGNKTEDTQKTVFTMGIDPEYPPFSYMDDKGNYTGFDVEVCKAACAELGWDFKVFAVNWDQKLVQLDAKECDCVWSGMTVLDSMKEAGYTIGTPYFYNTQVMLVKNSAIKTSKDLANKVVAVQLGTSGDELLQNKLTDLAKTFKNVVTCDSFLKCFAELDGNAVDAVFVDYPVAKDYIKGKTGYTIIDEGFGAEEYGIAYRSGDKDMCAKMDSAVQTLVKNGTYEKIAANYPEIVDNLIFLSK